jgi:signal transduction histidine kinase/CheY-like chemotaxis protein
VKFNNLINQLKQRNKQLLVRSGNLPLYLAISVPLALNISLAVGSFAYFSARQAEMTINEIASKSSVSLSDRLMARLYNYVETTEIEEENRQAQIVNQTGNYVQQISVGFAAKVIIIDKQGSIIASNYERQNNNFALATQDILNYLKKRFSNFSEIEQMQSFSFQTRQQHILVRVIPWRDRGLGLDWLTIVTIPKSELIERDDEIFSPSRIETSSLAAGQRGTPQDLLSNWKLSRSNQLWKQYLAYLLPTVVSGIIIYFWLNLVIKNKIERAIAQKQGEQIVEASASMPLEELSERQIPLNYDKNSLLVEMSHDLRSPLNSILGFVQIMNKESSMARSQLENLAIINRSGKRLLSLINDLIDLSKIETKRFSLELNNFDFALWLDNMEQNIKFQAHNQSLEFSLIRNGNLPQYICLDERRLRQVLTNLIDYSLRYTRAEETIVRVSCSEVSRDSTAAEIKSPPKRQLKINFVIENHDFPITSEELSTLFDPLARVSQKYKSSEVSSLSLPISRQLAQLMGGDITVTTDNNFPGGIIFNLDIQAEVDTTPELQIESTPRKIIGLEPDDREYRILIVDDSKTNRKIMVQLLEPLGFKVKEAVNGKEAVDIWLHWQPHMIWMDIRMPVMNGYEATEQIKSYSQTPSTPIVALTAGTLEEERSLFQASGCDDFVGKPFSDSIIFDKIAQHLGVRYVYESTPNPVSKNFKLTANALKIMPDNWLTEVAEAATTLDRNLLTQLLEQIPPDCGDLQEALQNQVDNFDFDKILALVRESQQR